MIEEDKEKIKEIIKLIDSINSKSLLDIITNHINKLNTIR